MNLKVQIGLFITLIVFIAYSASAQSDIVGRWKTVDDSSGKEKSIVEIYQKGNLYYGKVIKLYRSPDQDQNPVCKECDKTDLRYNQPVLGMNILLDLKKNGNEYDGGTVLDPENGSVYKCKIWIENGDFMLRGYIGFFFRTQTWKKI